MFSTMRRAAMTKWKAVALSALAVLVLAGAAPAPVQWRDTGFGQEQSAGAPREGLQDRLKGALRKKVLTADEAFHLSVTRGAGTDLTFTWTIAPGTYLYRDSLKAARDGTPVTLVSAPGEEKDDPNFGRVEIYHDATQATASGLPATGRLDVSFQGCAQDGICYPPVTRQVDIATLSVSAAPDRIARATTDPEATATRATTAPTTTPPGSAASEDASLLAGSLGAMLAAFLGFGLLLAFTPCVFPMVPILSGILAGHGERPSAGRGFLLSGAYVLAMAAAYGVLGLVAGWSGANLQAALQTPWALGLMALVLACLSLSMFGLFDLSVPAQFAARLQGGGRGGALFGAAAMGFASALVVGPCVTPPLAAAMLYAAQTGDGARGGAALFMLGLGMGLPLMAAGTFGARILPRSGPWLEMIKRACGVLFLAVAVSLAARLLPGPAGLALWSLLALGVGVFLGALDRPAPESGAGARLGRTAGLAALVYGVALLVGAAGGAGDPTRPLAFLAGHEGAVAAAPAEARVSSPKALDAALAAARQDGRPALVTFTAGWCTVCKSNEEVMAEPEVRARLAGLPRIVADVTDYGAGARALMERFSVIGPPTLFLLDGTGRELPGSRRIGAVTPDDLSTLAATAGL